ncbi:Proline dehydrogenase 1 [bacterium HR11]|nr:Proline dehydrogenase 1 [bacterium HR11]
MLRAFFLYLSRVPRMQDRIVRFAPTRRAARRFIAGESLTEALTAIVELNRRGSKASLNFLGENVHTPDEARAAQSEYFRQVEEIHRRDLDSNISVKLTQLGLDLSTDLCFELVRAIVERAQGYGRDVEIDMEGSDYTDRTLEVVHRLRDEFEGVGVAIQAYLYRSERDLRALISRGIKVRLVKGAYREPPDRAFPRKRQVDENYRRLMDILLAEAPRFAIATHDIRMIRHAVEYVRAHGITPPRTFEFQMIYGIRRDLQQKLLEEGWPLRVYVPYGTHWYPYFMRRLAERPANVGFILRHLFR